MIFTVNGKRVDYSGASHLWKPLAEWPVGDLRALEALGVKLVGRSSDAGLSISEGVAVLFHLARKCTRTVTLADFDALTIADLGPMLTFLSEKTAPPVADEDSDNPEKGSAAGAPATPVGESPLPGGSFTPPTT